MGRRCTTDRLSPRSAEPPSTRLRRHRLQSAVDYIERHLTDPALSPATIARGNRISQRYLHLLFHPLPDSVMGFVVRRRVEVAAECLKNSCHADRSITTIAMDCGFSSATHFGRAFRARFATTPQAYRRRCLESAMESPGARP